MTEEQVFLDALELENPKDRTAFLERVCGSDSELRRQVERLLDAHFKPGAFLDEPLIGALQSNLHTPSIDETIVLQKQEGGEIVADEKNPNEEPDDLRFLGPSTRPDSLGRLEHYEILEVLGRGGFGIVFRAFDDSLQRVVAIKVLAPSIAATSPARKRFSREARSSAKIRHENVVHIYAVGDHPLPYLVMEFIPGESLQQRIDRTGPLEVDEIVHLGRQIAEGLAAAHATGLIHRDIKPGNILIEQGPQNRVHITDFGLARAADDASMTQSGMLSGTPLYMAPEQAKGESMDHRADLFSLGSVLYTLVAGRSPFRAPTTFGVLRRVVEDRPRPIRELIPETPQWLCDIIARLHAKNPDDRFQSARELADVLASCEAQQKTSQTVDFLLPWTPGEPGLAPAKHTATRKHASRKWKWVAAAAILLGVLTLSLLELIGVTRWLRSPVPAPDSPDKNGAPLLAGDRAEEKGLPSTDPKKDTEVKKNSEIYKDSVIRPGTSSGAKPFTDADIKRIAALPALEQVEEVRKELARRNPDFTLGLTPTIENEVVVGLEFQADRVTDISPLRALTRLTALDCSAAMDFSGKLIDLSPLRGLPLTRLACVNHRLHDLSPLKGMNLFHLRIDSTQVFDLSPLKGMPLQELSLGFTKVSDLSPLKGMQLTHVVFGFSEVADLTPLTGMPLKNLDCANTKISSLAPLKGMDLRDLNFGTTKVVDLSPLQGMKLENIYFTDTKVSDLSPLKGMQLRDLWLGPLVTDLGPIQGMPLLRIDIPAFKTERDARILRSISTLASINNRSSEQFWRAVDEGKIGRDGSAPKPGP